MSRAPRRLRITVAEQFCILAALSAAGVWTSSDYSSGVSRWLTVLALWVTFGACWAVISKRLGAHSIAPSRNLALSFRRTMESWAATWGIAGLFAVTTAAPDSFQIWVVLITGAALLAFLRLATSFSTLEAGTQRLRAIVIGSCPSARALTSTQDTRDAFDFFGFVPFTNEDPQNMPHLARLGQVHELAQMLREHDIDVAFVSPSDDAITGEVHQVMDICEAMGLQTQYFPSFLDVDDMRVGMAWSANRPGLNVQAIGETSWAALTKRAIDIVGAAIGILLLLPVFVSCALAVKLTSAGPVFYRQTRVGKSGRSFSCFKFRTMKVGAHAMQEQLRSDSQQDGPAFKIAHDPRITSAGRILRKFSLDELPQLINVLLGDMSIVGPRPPIPSEVDKYTWWQRRRIAIKPGLTCVWQVYGRNRVSFKRWVEMDLYYIDNWSLWLDIKLILHTVRVVVRGTGM